MTSIRLPLELQTKLAQIAETKHTTQSKIIRDALEQYINNYFKNSSPYQLGQDLFGKHGSGQNNLSRDYKKIIRDSICDKLSN
jgi:predicted DNA-binding protein